MFTEWTWERELWIFYPKDRTKVDYFEVQLDRYQLEMNKTFHQSSDGIDFAAVKDLWDYILNIKQFGKYCYREKSNNGWTVLNGIYDSVHYRSVLFYEHSNNLIKLFASTNTDFTLSLLNLISCVCGLLVNVFNSHAFQQQKHKHQFVAHSKLN